MINKLMDKKVFVILTALFCCALWGISTPIVKIGYNYVDASHVPSLLLWVGLQFLLAGILTVGTYSVFSGKLVVPQRESVKGVVLISVLQTVLQYSLLYIGLSHTTSVKGAILKSTDVFVVALLAGLVFRTEKLTVKKVVSCVIGFLGIIVMNLNGLSLQISPLGDGLVLLAIVSYSFSVIMVKFFAQKEDPITLCGYQMAIGGIVVLLIGTVLGGSMDIVGLLPILLGLSALYAVSYTLWTVLLKYNPASSIVIYSFMTPVFGVIFSILLLSENSGVAPVSLLVALLLVCVGIVLWGYEKKPCSVGALEK